MDAAVVEAAPVPPERTRAPRRWPGRVALALAAVTPLLVIAGIETATRDGLMPAWWLGGVAIATSVLAVVGGVVAVATGWGRGPGIGGIILGVLANPVVLVWALDLLEGL